MWDPHQRLDLRQRRKLGALAVAAVLAVWSVTSGLGLVSEARLPTPWGTAGAFLRLAWDADRGESLLLTATLWSVGRVAAAFVFVVAIGVPIGVLMGASPRINALLSPLVDPFRSAPVVALLPIFVMWLGIGEWMKIAFLFAGAVVYLIPLTRDAMQAVPRAYWEGARDLGATPREAILHTVLPLARPRIADGVIVSTSIMWTYITVAEYVNAREGLGQVIQNARRFSAMDQVFVGIFVIIALALLTHFAMTTLKQKLYPWETD